ncbi:MAG: hypothetical protein C0467_30070 [Planctomycetaceae bacterium]|nr:hypothetical protein [Planctomycetaceae bacterium]
MSNRETLLGAIKANPHENTPRLVYADWLEEFGAGDLDAATVEFIRVSCGSRYKPGMSMPAPAYQWIEGHWPRLIPAVLMEHVVIPQSPMFQRDGRKIWFPFRGRDRCEKTGELIPWKKSRSTEWWFHRGFVEGVRIFASHAYAFLRPLVEVDQPIARFLRSM